MSRKAVKPRIAWEDRFQEPGADDLLTGLGKQQAALLAQARQSFTGLPNVIEKIEWRGVPWRWSFVYLIEGNGSRPWAYIVPQPGKPTVAIPMNAELAGSAVVRRMPRWLRDTVQFSTQVAGVYWPQWELTSRAQLDEIVVRAKKKHETLKVPTAAR